MKKSTEYSIGDSVNTVDGLTLTKQSDAQVVPDGVPGLVEIWTDVNGAQYTPTLSFQEGTSDPAFNSL